MSHHHCDIRETLAAAGLTKTSQRVAVLETLVETDTPVCVRTILERIDDECRINKVTAYRILDSFRAAGIIREIPTEHGERFYEMACRHNPLHAHFYCRVCRNLSCLPPDGAAEQWLGRFRAGRETVETIVVNLSGVCTRCLPRKRGKTVR